VNNECKEVGTVEILTERIYQIDPDTSQATTAVVEPGVYPLYEYGEAKFWVMEGFLNLALAKAGDGLFIMHGGDVKSNVPVRFPSRSYGPEQWQALLEDEVCQPGPEQRLKIEEKVAV
jgi:hypothetical protein